MANPHSDDPDDDLLSPCSLSDEEGERTGVPGIFRVRSRSRSPPFPARRPRSSLYWPPGFPAEPNTESRSQNDLLKFSYRSTHPTIPLGDRHLVERVVVPRSLTSSTSPDPDPVIADEPLICTAEPTVTAPTQSDSSGTSATVANVIVQFPCPRGPPISYGPKKPDIWQVLGLE